MNRPADLATLSSLGALGGIAAIAAERQRQVTDLGWLPMHDATHSSCEMARAAAAYAIPASTSPEDGPLVDMRKILWPWGHTDTSPTSATGPDVEKRLRELEKAGALIAAEHDRITTAFNARVHTLGIPEPEPVSASTHGFVKPKPGKALPGTTDVTLRIDMTKEVAEVSIASAVGAVLAGYLARLSSGQSGSTDAETFDAATLGLSKTWLRDVVLTVTSNDEPDQAAKQLADKMRLRPYSEWNDDEGAVLWWALRNGQVEEPPCHAGTPSDDDFPYSHSDDGEGIHMPEGYTLHWTPLLEPSPII